MIFKVGPCTLYTIKALKDVVHDLKRYGLKLVLDSYLKSQLSSHREKKTSGSSIRTAVKERCEPYAAALGHLFA